MAAEAVRGWLEEIGVHSDADLSVLFTDEECENGIMSKEVAKATGLAEAALADFVNELRRAINDATARTSLLRRAEAGQPSWQAAARAAKRYAAEEWRAEEERYTRAKQEVRRAAPPPPPPHTTVGSATRRQQRLDGDPCGRARGEEEERARWVNVLVELVRASGVAVLSPEWDGLDHASLVALVAGGRRASTLRARARSWKSFSRFLMLANGRPHPRTGAEAWDYVQIRAAEPCSRAVLLHLRSLFGFLESVTNASPPLLSDRVIAAGFKELLSQAPARRDGDSAPASRWPAALLARMERTVVSADSRLYDVLQCWWLLLSCWSTLRFDDHRGIEPGAFRAASGGTAYDLTRSKTTGPDKGTRIRPCFLSDGAYLEHPTWFHVGLEAWKVAAPQARDYMLCVPNGDMTGVLSREIAHGEFAARMRGYLAALDCGGVTLGSIVACHFSPHSGRNFLISAAVAMGTNPEEVRKLGAWSAKGGIGYIRTAREFTARLQDTVAKALRGARGGRDVIADAEAVASLEAHMTKRGLERGQREPILKALAWSPGGPSDRTVGTMVPGQAGSSGETGPAAETDIAEQTARPRGVADASAAGAARSSTESEVQGYVCSITGRRAVRRLHFVGLCYRRPGLDYSQYVQFNDVVPGPEDYDLVCRQCWPTGTPSARETAASSSVPSSDESSSSSDSA